MENSTSSVYYGVSKPRIFLASMIQSSNTLFKIAMGSLTYIATGGFGLTVLLAGWIASAARIFDGITDPIAGMVCSQGALAVRRGERRYF